MNLLLIQNDFNEIRQYLNNNTDYIIFHPGQTYDQLLSEIDNKNTNYSTIGIFSHGNLKMFHFIEPVFSTEQNTDFLQFMKSVSNKTQFSTLDIFACNFGINSQFVSDLENELGVNVRASTNNTGNTPFGDWIMETDQQDIKLDYFTDQISSFNKILTSLLKNLNYYNDFINELKTSSDASNQIYFTSEAFAALNDDGSVVTWGHSGYGGDSSSVDLSSGVVKIYSSDYAFAALKDNGSVVAWGYGGWGGSPSSSELSSEVVKIYSTHGAFAALKDNGSVVTWGYGPYGGDSSLVDLSSGVVKIYSNLYAFAALKDNGSVVTWGWTDFGGDSSSVDLSSGVVKIYSSDFAFAALKDNGSVVTWGFSGNGGDSSYVASDLLSGVVKIYSTSRSFAALKDDGSVVTWGSSGGDSGSVATDLLSGVVKIYSTSEAFAALKDDGSVVTWGRADYGGDSSSVDLSSGVVKIYSNLYAFAALKDNGSVVTWGHSGYGGDSSSVDLSNGVVKIYSTSEAFAALKEDGSVVTWGNTAYLGETADPTNPVLKIVNSPYAFVLVYEDSTIKTNGSDQQVFSNTFTPSIDFTDTTVSNLNYEIENFEVLSLNAFPPDTTAPVITLIGSSTVNLSVGETYIELGATTDTGEPTIIAGSVDTTVANTYTLTYNATDASGNAAVQVTRTVIVSTPASSNGDPYVTTLCGNKFKLPNSIRTYRLIEQSVNDKDLIVNASVSMLTKEEVDKLKLIASLYTKQKPVTYGYFYEKFFVSYGGKYAVFDRNINLIETNITQEIMKELNISIEYMKDRPFSCPIQGNSTSSDTVISVFGSVITLKSINHPQIINGIEFYTSKKTDTVSGILNTYLHPRNYVIKNVNSTKKIKIKVNRGYSKSVPEKWIPICK